MALTIALQDEILSDIETIDKDPNLYQQKNFNARAGALDFLEFHVIDRIDTQMMNQEPADQMNELKEYANRVISKLEEVNREMFQKLRLSIRQDGLRGMELMNLITECLNDDVQAYSRHETTGYDNMDLFMNGMLTYQDLPAETRDREPDMVFYQKTPVRIILELIKRAEFKLKDVFYDLGSGMGQVCVMVNLLTSIRSRGVEFEPAFCDYAKNCAAGLQLKDVVFINTDARDADYASGTVFFMYTPFEGKMLLEVLEKLKSESKNRKIKLFTYGPCTVQVVQQDWLIQGPPIQMNPGALCEFHSI